LFLWSENEQRLEHEISGWCCFQLTGDDARSFVAALQGQDDLQSDIQEITRQLDQFQQRLDQSDEDIDLRHTLQTTQVGEIYWVFMNEKEIEK